MKVIILHLKAIFVIALLVFATFELTTLAEASSKSPNGFSNSQCTGYVDNKTSDLGWKLKFSSSRGDAYKWYKKGYIKNANRGNIGKPGDIMVFDNGNDSNKKDYSKGHHGHIAFVISSGTWKGQRAWTVRQTNWGTGFGQWVVPDETRRYGSTVTQCTFVEYKKKWLKIQSGNSLGKTGYPLLGFLYRK